MDRGRGGGCCAGPRNAVSAFFDSKSSGNKFLKGTRKEKPELYVGRGGVCGKSKGSLLYGGGAARGILTCICG